MTTQSKSKADRLIWGFYFYSSSEIPVILHNCHLLLAKVPRAIRNHVLIYLLNATIDHTVDRLLLETYQALKLLESTYHCIDWKNRDFKHLRILRDKLLTHRFEDLPKAGNTDWHKWYQDNYGKQTNVFALIERVGRKIQKLIMKLEYEKKLPVMGVSNVPMQVKLTAKDVTALLLALKRANLL